MNNSTRPATKSDLGFARVTSPDGDYRIKDAKGSHITFVSPVNRHIYHVETLPNRRLARVIRQDHLQDETVIPLDIDRNAVLHESRGEKFTQPARRWENGQPRNQPNFHTRSQLNYQPARRNNYLPDRWQNHHPASSNGCSRNPLYT